MSCLDGAGNRCSRTTVVPRIGKPGERVGAHDERALGKHVELLEKLCRLGEPEGTIGELGGAVSHSDEVEHRLVDMDLRGFQGLSLGLLSRALYFSAGSIDFEEHLYLDRTRLDWFADVAGIDGPGDSFFLPDILFVVESEPSHTRQIAALGVSLEDQDEAAASRPLLEIGIVGPGCQ